MPLTEDFSCATPDKKISISEKTGLRPSQQDAIFVAHVGDEFAKADPALFLQNAAQQSVAKHQHCFWGTTACSVFVSPPKAGRKFPKLTVSNLGDSRAALVAKIKKLDGEISHISVLLTQDHGLDVERIRAHVVANGGTIIETSTCPRLASPFMEAGNGLNMGASIGDRMSSNKDGTNPLMTDPDIIHYEIETIFGDLTEFIESIDVVVACDGLSDLHDPHCGEFSMLYDYRFLLEDGSVVCEFGAHADEDEVHLSVLAAEYEAKGHPQGFAGFLADRALKEGSRDNVSVAAMRIFDAKTNQVSKDTILAVFDGHGTGDAALPENRVVMEDADGSIVAACVAADFYEFFGCQKIPGLEMPKRIFDEILNPTPSPSPVEAVYEAVAAHEIEAGQQWT